MPAVSANQGIAISPIPGSLERYYIFAINAAGNLDYSIVDMGIPGNSTGAGNLGSVTTWRQALPGGLGTNVSQAMIVVPKATLANGYWLITQQPNSAIFKVIDINGGGIASETTTDFQGPGIVPLTASNFSIHSTGMLSVTPTESNKNVQFYNFDTASGAISFDQDVQNSNTFDAASPEALYDSEFNPTGDIIFVSQHGSTDPAGLFAYEYGNISQSRRQLFPGTIFRSYGLKYGEDLKIYHLYQEAASGPFLVGRIENPDAPIDSLIYTERVFGGRDFGGKQFPSILPPKVITPTVPTIMNLGSCTTDTVWFFADMDPFTDQFLWDFQDTNFGADASGVSPGYNFQNPGTYDITLTTRVAGNPVLSTPLTLNILQTQLQMDLGQDTVICPGETLEIKIDDQTYPQLQNVIWSTGDTNVQSINVTEGGTYWASGEDISTGCVLHDAIAVDEYGIDTQISNIWYFGQNAGLDFNQQPPDLLADGLMVAPEGCSAISDINGEILFYTDGRTVYSVVNDVHQQMPNGDNLSGDPGSAQSSIIVQFPSDETLFYIFTTNCTNPLVACSTFQLSYSVVDLKATPGGNVVIKNKPLFQYSTERIAATTFGNSVVLLAHEFGTNTFRAYPVSPLGIGAPVLSSVGSVHSQYDQLMGEGYMKFSADGTKVAVALPSTGSNAVELFDFDAGTGILTNPLSLDLGNSSGTVYGIEFSPNSNWLYATLSGPNSIIYQWHVDSTTLAGNITDPNYIINSRAQVPSGSTSDALGAIQLGPNSVMYVAIDGQNFLGIINNPDGQQDGTTNATADLTFGQPLAAGTTSGLGLPNFVQNSSTQQPQPEIFLPPFACVGETITFEATATSIIDQFSWSIFNSSGALLNTSMNPIDTISFNIPDDYIFTVRVYNRCLDPIAILTDTVRVEAIPQQTTGPVAVALCDQPVTLMPYDDGPHPEYTYLWSNGATTQDLTVSIIGTYDLVITTTTGCTLDYSVFVGPPFAVDLGPDQTLCDGQALTLDSQANADDYIWEIIVSGVVTPILGFETSRFLPLDQIAPPLTTGAVNTITVGVVDPINPGCIVRDTIDITVNADPVVVVTSTDDTDCDPTVNDGSITISDHPTDDLDYVISGPSTFTGLIVAGTGPVTITLPPTDLAAGVYTVDVQSNVTGCSFVTTIVINEPAAFMVASTSPTPDDCDLTVGAGTIDVTLDLNIFPIDYIVTDQSGATVASLTGVPDAGALNFVIPGLLAGTYNIEVSTPTLDPNACSAFATGIIVPVTPPTDLQGPLQVTECDTSVDLSLFFTSLTPTTDIEWSLDGTPGSYQDATTVPFNVLGESMGVFIKASTNPLVTCDSIRNVDIVLTPQPDVEIVIDDVNCNGFVTLSTNILNDFAGAVYSYAWTGGGQPTTISVQPTVDVTVNGTYEVVVSHSNNLGCFSDPPGQITVEVPIPFVAQLASTPACTDKEYDVIASSIGTGGVVLPPELMVYKWFIDGVEQPGETFQLIRRENTPGLYRVEITDEQGCVQSDEINIIVNDPTISEILPIYNVCFAEIGVLVVDPVSTFVNYAWYNTNDPNNPILIATTPTLSTNIPGSFRADLTNGFQCVTGDAFNVVEDCEALIYGPNALRPGSSIPENNVFFLDTEYVEDFQIFIYSRWGELVFESADKAFQWDGTLNGTLLQAGSYTYIVKYTKEFGGTGETLVQYGGVTIIR
jgi:gliding motility-associated-like protein